MDTKIVELNTDIYEQLTSMKSSNQTFTDLIIDLINDDYRYNQLKAFFNNKDNISENLAESLDNNLSLDFITEVFDEDVRYTISLKIPNIKDNYSIIVSEDNLEEYDKNRTLNQNTKNMEIELFTFNRLFEIGIDDDTIKYLNSDLNNDYTTNKKYYTLNHVLIRSINNIIEMLVNHKLKLLKFEEKLLEKINESPDFRIILKNEIELNKIKRIFNKEIFNRLS
ncbi:MAG: hypothetical protein E7Z84_03840 [Methanosphaera stadtmanae]|nr:hypothetical protein [Methanosphaera stadtmanae]